MNSENTVRADYALNADNPGNFGMIYDSLFSSEQFKALSAAGKYMYAVCTIHSRTYTNQSLVDKYLALENETSGNPKDFDPDCWKFWGKGRHDYFIIGASVMEHYGITKTQGYDSLKELEQAKFIKIVRKRQFYIRPDKTDKTPDPRNRMTLYRFASEWKKTKPLTKDDRRMIKRNGSRKDNV